MQGLLSDDELRALVPQVLEGDLDVAGEFFGGIHPHLMAFLHVIGVGLTADQIEEVAQDVCLELYSNLVKYDQQCPFLPWMRGVARNTCRFYIRKAKRLGTRDQFLANYLRTRFEVEPEEETRVDALRECAEKLNESQRELISMRFVNGLNSQEIGKQLRKTPLAVRRTLSRIYEILRTCMEGALEA